MAYSSALTIEELDSNFEAIRTLTLRGGGLPKQGAAWPTESVVPTTWYPGNPDDATQQVLVSKDMPSSWEGEWNITRLTRSPCLFDDVFGQLAVTAPSVLVDAFDGFQRRGRLLRVTWAVGAIAGATGAVPDGIARTVMRLGRIQRFEPKYIRSVDILWSAEFVWKSRGGIQARVVSTRDDNAPSAAANLIAAMQASMDAASKAAFLASNPAINRSATAFSLGQLEQIVQAPLQLVQAVTSTFNRLIGQFQQVSDIAGQVKNLPFAIANNVLDMVSNAIDVGQQFSETLSETPAEQLTTSQRVSDITRAMTYFGGVDDATEAAVQQALQTQAQLREAASTNPSAGEVSVDSASGAVQGQIITVHITKKGDTPMSLSLTYYQSADHDIDILRANRLPWYQASFAPGTLLVIPVVSTSTGP